MDLITPQCIEGTLGIFTGLFVDLMGLEESQKAFAMVLPGKTGLATTSKLYNSIISEPGSGKSHDH